MRHARPDYERFQDPAGIIPEDEPVFLIRGQDVAGPATLREYAKFAEARGAKASLVFAVLNHAQAMEDWQRTRAFKVPDL